MYVEIVINVKKNSVRKVWVNAHVMDKQTYFDYVICSANLNMKYTCIIQSIVTDNDLINRFVNENIWRLI